MEQNNLIVTPDGKNWDEVTRDTSYIGNKVMEAGHDGGNGSTSPVIFDEHRGLRFLSDRGAKDFVWGYDKAVCLVPGQYYVWSISYSHSVGMMYGFSVNVAPNWSDPVGTMFTYNKNGTGTNGDDSYFVSGTLQLNRGDYIMFGASGGNLDDQRTKFGINRVG